MPIEFTKRDLQVVIDKLNEANQAADNLAKMESTSAIRRPLAIAITNLETAILWMERTKTHTPDMI